MPRSVPSDTLRIVVPDDAPPAVAGTRHARDLAALGDLRVHDTLAADPATLLARIRDAHVAICIRNSSLFTADVLDACPNLRHIVVFGIGVDMVDLDACRRLGILVSNTPGYSAAAVAEHAIALALAVARNVPHNDRLVRQGEWARAPVAQLAGKTLGVIGAGPIGMRAAGLGRGLGMRVLAWSFHPDEARAQAGGFAWAALPDLLREADVVTVHLRLSDESRGLLSGDMLAHMKQGAIFVNTARGAIADEDALFTLLAEGRIAGAGLDVFAQEPLPPSHPFTTQPNVVLSPHLASSTPETDDLGLAMVVENIRRWLGGDPAHVVA